MTHKQSSVWRSTTLSRHVYFWSPSRTLSDRRIRTCLVWYKSVMRSFLPWFCATNHSTQRVHYCAHFNDNSISSLLKIYFVEKSALWHGWINAWFMGMSAGCKCVYTAVPVYASFKKNCRPYKRQMCGRNTQKSLSYIFYGVSLAGVTCRRHWPPPTTPVVTMLLD